MAIKRPSLTEDSFLRHLFSPKKNPLPTGLRARAIAFTKGRKKARVASYNRMSAKSQELLKRSGLRESYLKGEASLSDAKAVLRNTAVNKGFARPSRTPKATTISRSSSLDVAVAAHVIRELRDSGRHVNPDHVHRNVRFLPEDVKDQARKWGVGQIRAYAGDESNRVEVDFQDAPYNPLWYK